MRHRKLLTDVGEAFELLEELERDLRATLSEVMRARHGGYYPWQVQGKHVHVGKGRHAVAGA